MVKPFDSKKFVQNCRTLIGDIDDEYEEEDYEEEEESDDEYEYVDKDSEEDDEYEYEEDEYEEDSNKKSGNESHDNWVVKGSNKEPENQNDASMTISRLEENAQKLKLEKELDEWGGDLPSVINVADSRLKESLPLPPPIAKLQSSKKSDSYVDKGDDLFPDDNDLGYPEESEKEELELSKEIESSQRFLSVDELIESDEEDEEELTDPSFTLPDKLNKDLENEIDLDTSPDDFWAVDSTENNQKITKEETSFEKGSSYSQKGNESEVPKDLDVKESSKISIDELKPMIEAIVKQYCEDTINKVAWEVIPDLAENLIKEELKEISQKIE